MPEETGNSRGTDNDNTCHGPNYMYMYMYMYKSTCTIYITCTYYASKSSRICFRALQCWTWGSGLSPLPSDHSHYYTTLVPVQVEGATHSTYHQLNSTAKVSGTACMFTNQLQATHPRNESFWNLRSPLQCSPFVRGLRFSDYFQRSHFYLIPNIKSLPCPLN